MWCRFRFLVSRYRRPLNLNGQLASYSSKAVATPSPPPSPPPPNGGHFTMLGLFGALTGGFAVSSYTAAYGGGGGGGGGDDEVGFTYSKSDLQSNDAIWALYKRWCRHYNISRTHEEMEKRFDIFRRHAFHAYEVNNLHFSTMLDLNQFADETEEELKVVMSYPYIDEEDDEDCDCGSCLEEGNV